MEIYFNRLPVCAPDPTRDRAILREDWSFFIDSQEFWICTGYDFDGASIPRPVWPIIGSPFEPCLWAPALAHDWLYLTHLTDRATADETIYQLMRQCKVASWRAHIIWGAVRSGAWWAWDNNAADVAELARIRAELLLREDGRKFRV